MTLRHTHIISSVGWNTTFTLKGRAGDLQDRLSRWSRWKMPDVVQSVLDSLCPADQHWHIDQLNINLGTIDYANMESELNALVHDALHEALCELLLSRLPGDDTKFRIAHVDTSDLHALGFFLQNGYMPWNHNSQILPYNKLLSHLLQSKKHATILLIRSIGKDNPEVRKRIAWQTDEPVLQQLVKGLEPVHHTEIRSFTDEMIVLQQRENLVTAAQHGFRKNLWNWILNYLLQEKDTLFNKLAFVKSSLRQMSAHYNIDYEKLLIITSRAVEAVRKKMQLRTDLGRTLALLTQQIENTDTVQLIAHQGSVLWERFSILLHNEGQRKTRKGQEEFNELFIALAATDKARFMALIYPLGFSSKSWDNIAVQLSDESLEVLFDSVNPRQGSQWFFILQCMRRTGASFISAEGELILRTSGIKFLLRYQRSSQKNETFAGYCAGQLVKFAGLRPVQVHKLFSSVLVKNSYATLQQVEIAESLQRFFLQQLQNKKDKNVLQDIAQILTTISAHKESLSENKRDELEQMVRHLLFTGASSFINALEKHPKKTEVLDCLLTLTGQGELNVCLIQSSHLHARLIRTVTTTMIAIFEANAELVDWISRNLPAAAFKMIIDRPSISAAALLRNLIRRLVLQQNLSDKAEMEVLMLKCQTATSVSRSMKAMVRNLLDQVYSNVNPKERIRIWERFSVKQRADRQQLAQHILLCRQQPVYRDVTTMPFSESTLILEKLVPGASVFGLQLLTGVEQFFKEKGSSAAGIVQQVKEVFWRSALAQSIAGGNITGLRKQLQQFFAIQLPDIPILWQQSSSSTKQTGPNITGISDPKIKLTGDYVLSILQDKNFNSKSFIRIMDKEFSKSAFLQHLLTIETDVLIAAIKKGNGAPGVLKQLKSDWKLEEFIWWMKEALPVGQSFLLNELQHLLSITGKLNSEAGNKFEDRAWVLTIAIIRGNIRNGATMQRIAKEIIQPLLLKKLTTVEELLSKISSIHFPENSPVRFAFRELMPAVFSKLTVAKQDETLELFQQLSEKGLITELTDTIIREGVLPYWLFPEIGSTSQEWASLLIAQQPAQVLKALRKADLNSTTFRNFSGRFSFNQYIRALQQAWPQQATSLDIAARLYDMLWLVNINGIPPTAIQDVLYRLLIRIFKSDSRGNTAPHTLWKQLMIELCTAFTIRPIILVEAMQQHSGILPPAILAANKLLFQEMAAMKNSRYAEKKTVPSPKRIHSTKDRKGSFETGADKIAVKNAGLVIINMYLPILFRRLGLLTDELFISPEHQQDAVHYLQYLAAAQYDAPEEYLVLNKILCGLPLDGPVKDRIEITEQDKETIEGLISAVVNYWAVIGETSVGGFRGNWLVRDGLVYETEENWYLTVEKRPYDVLLAKSPFSFSVIRYPWMSKPLKTEWPF